MSPDIAKSPLVGAKLLLVENNCFNWNRIMKKEPLELRVLRMRASREV